MELSERTPIHPTYQEIKDVNSDLQQGDILRPSEELLSIFHKTYNDIFDKGYLAFIVLTQTCDMVRRKDDNSETKKCKSKIINLAGVRLLEDIWSSLVDRVCCKATIGGQAIPNVYELDTRSKAHELLNRIINQNAQAEGLFYLHPDGAVEIGNPAVALLQVSIGIGIQHYEKLIEARSGRLAGQFQSKLGWLVGNLFSRVATDDLKEEIAKKIANEFLGPGQKFKWVERSKVKNAQRRPFDLSNKTDNEIVEFINSQPGQRDVVLKTVVDIVRQTLSTISSDDLRTLENKLATNSTLGSALKK
jgi:hypothetical protein